jgi:Rps23 Pro-64 3,4-dihydroxylase Tpa1-like proline 4-hydroxylase
MIKNIFGNWIDNIELLHTQFINNKPFPHIIIQNFLKKDIIENVYNSFPEFDDNWWVYNNPIEVKYSNDKISNFDPIIQKVFSELSTTEMIKKLQKLTGIDNLEIDPTIHGAGLHMHPRNGRLMMHLDYEKHPTLKNKQRRINIILYLSKDWKREWNGSTELWDSNMKNKIKESNVIFNNALIFQTNEQSWHGIPEKILCPENVFRKSLAYYYVSPLINKSNKNKVGSNSNGFREKAAFSLRPSDKKDERILKLLSIRPFRRISEEDMEKIYPEWDKNLD